MKKVTIFLLVVGLSSCSKEATPPVSQKNSSAEPAFQRNDVKEAGALALEPVSKEDPKIELAQSEQEITPSEKRIATRAPAAVEIQDAQPVQASPRLISANVGPEVREDASLEPVSPNEPRAEEERREPAPLESAQGNEELIFAPKIGYGGKYISLKQSGAFGGGHGSGIAANNLQVSTKISYGNWNFTAALEKISLDLSRNTATETLRESRNFKNLSLNFGYGAFYTGINAATAPLMQISGTTIQWGDLNTVSALAGVRMEKEFVEGRKKPFKLGLDVQGGYIFSGSGVGPTITSPKGFGIELRAHAEKIVLRREDFDLVYGLEAGGSYDSVTTNGSWNNSSGETKRNTYQMGALFYLGAKF